MEKTSHSGSWRPFIVWSESNWTYFDLARTLQDLRERHYFETFHTFNEAHCFLPSLLATWGTNLRVGASFHRIEDLDSDSDVVIPTLVSLFKRTGVNTLFCLGNPPLKRTLIHCASYLDFRAVVHRPTPKPLVTSVVPWKHAGATPISR